MSIVFKAGWLSEKCAPAPPAAWPGGLQLGITPITVACLRPAPPLGPLNRKNELGLTLFYRSSDCSPPLSFLRHVPCDDPPFNACANDLPCLRKMCALTRREADETHLCFDTTSTDIL